MKLYDAVSTFYPDVVITLCDSMNFYIDPISGSKIYYSIFQGTFHEIPDHLLERNVEKSFISFLWNTNTFVLG